MRVIETIKRIPDQLWWDVKDVIDKFKWAYQRMVRGYDDRVYWNLDSYLTDIILPVLKHYKTHKMGLPPNRDYVFKEGDDFGDGFHTPESWDKEMDKMIATFELLKSEDMPTGDEFDKQNKIIEEGLATFGRYYTSLWT